MGKIWALALKDLRLQKADKAGLFFIWGWPIIFTAFFGYVLGGLYSGDGGLRAIPVAVADEDRSDASKALIATLAGQESLKPREVDDRAAGEDLVRRGKLAACIVIPHGFQDTQEALFGGGVMEVEVVVDPSKPMEAATTRGLLQASLFRQFQRSFTSDRLKRGREEVLRAQKLPATQKMALSAFLMAAEHYTSELEKMGNATATSPASKAASQPESALAGWQPFRLQTREITKAPAGTGGERRPHSAFSIVIPQGIAWGVMACAATFAATLVVERTSGTLPRLLIAPVYRWQVLASKGLACFISTEGVMVGMAVLARFVFGVRFDSLALLLLAIVCIGVAVVGIMMLFSVLGRTEAAVSGMSWAILTIMAMLGGGMIPLSALGDGMKAVSVISIFRWMIQALDGAIWRNYSFTDMLAPCGVLVAIGACGFAVGMSAFRGRQGG